MNYDRYYYSVLPDADKRVYNKIYNGIAALQPRIALPRSALDSTPLSVIFEYVGLDNPHIFYVDFNQYQLSESLFERHIIITYWYTQAEIDEINKKINTILRRMLSRVSGTTDYEKELSVHDLLIGNIQYDYSALSNLHKHSPRSNSILGVLFYKTAVCEGIAKVFKMLLNMLDIPCIVAVGTEARQGVSHAWNVAKINGKTYHVDVTWDVGASRDGIAYEYFNLTDDWIMVDHSPRIRYPMCGATEDNYYVHSGLAASSLSGALQCLHRAKRLGKRPIALRLLCSSQDFRRNVKKLIDCIALSEGMQGKTCHYALNDEQKIVTVFFDASFLGAKNAQKIL